MLHGREPSDTLKRPVFYFLWSRLFLVRQTGFWSYCFLSKRIIIHTWRLFYSVCSLRRSCLSHEYICVDLHIVTAWHDSLGGKWHNQKPPMLCHVEAPEIDGVAGLALRSYAGCENEDERVRSPHSTAFRQQRLVSPLSCSFHCPSCSSPIGLQLLSRVHFVVEIKDPT